MNSLNTFALESNSKIKINFDGGDLSSDAGLLLFKETNFSARPVYHQKRDRIIAHFMICYTVLLIYRILEKKLNLNETHFTIDNVIETLNSMEVANIEDICYMSTYTSSHVCTALNAVIDLGLDKKYYQPKELNKKSKKISK